MNANEEFSQNEINDLPEDVLAEAAEIVDLKDARIVSLEEEVAKLKDSFVRAVAETDNVRKRSQRDLEENSKYAITGFAKDMVSVLENLKRASESFTPEAVAESALLKTISEGVELTLQELLGIFQKFGIVRVDPMGQKFDHNLHQAVAQVESADVETGTVIQVVQAGYMIADRLLRPAMVVVSKAANEAEKSVIA
jgi:molecular chaperone GrpE